MNIEILKQIAQQLATELHRRKSAIIGLTGRFPKRQLFLSFNTCKTILEEAFGGPVTSRWAAGRKFTAQETKILEYLVDYSICRFSIPQAIRQPKRNTAELQEGQSYEMLLAVESELGNDHEVMRDFLKLLDIKSRVKCLVYYRRIREANDERFSQRVNWVLSHHTNFDPNESILLVGLPQPKNARLTDDIEFRCVIDRKVAAL
jgi:hypothetical protein